MARQSFATFLNRVSQSALASVSETSLHAFTSSVRILVAHLRPSASSMRFGFLKKMGAAQGVIAFLAIEAGGPAVVRQHRLLRLFVGVAGAAVAAARNDADRVDGYGAALSVAPFHHDVAGAGRCGSSASCD